MQVLIIGGTGLISTAIRISKRYGSPNAPRRPGKALTRGQGNRPGLMKSRKRLAGPGGGLERLSIATIAPITRQLVARGDHVTLYNRGRREAPIPERVGRIQGDRTAYAAFEAQMADAGPFDCVIDWLEERDQIESHERYPAYDRIVAAWQQLGTNMVDALSDVNLENL